MGYGILPQFSKKKFSLKKQITSYDTPGSLPVLYRFFHALDQWFFDFCFFFFKEPTRTDTQFLCESGEIKNWIPIHGSSKIQISAQTQTGFAVCTTEEEKFGGPVWYVKENWMENPKKKEECTLKVERERQTEIMLHKLLAQGLPISTFWPVKSCVSEVGTAMHRWSKEQIHTHAHAILPLCGPLYQWPPHSN